MSATAAARSCGQDEARPGDQPTTLLLARGRCEMLEHPLGIPPRPWRARAGLRVLLIERDEQPHQLAPNRSSSENLGKLRQVTQPLGVPRSPVWIVAIDNPIHAMVCLAGLVQQLCDPVDPVIHSAQSDDFRARLRDFNCPVGLRPRDGNPATRVPVRRWASATGDLDSAQRGSRRYYAREARGARGAGLWSPITLRARKCQGAIRATRRRDGHHPPRPVT